jgi:hypothetical protein
VRRLWNRKGQAVKKWRSRAWVIDPKKTKITIIKAEASNVDDSAENIEITDLNLADPFSTLLLRMNKSPQLVEFCNRSVDALTDMEQSRDMSNPDPGIL